MNEIAAIFDMDGVVVDNYHYHRKAWDLFCEKFNLGFNDSFRSKIFGGTNRDHLEAFFGRPLNNEEIRRYETEKEQIYREIYDPDIVPVPGLGDFLKNLSNAGIRVALATSSPPVNVEFVLRKTNFKDHFRIVLDASSVTHGKPDPEIYLLTSERLGLSPDRCIVFEDSVIGIQAALKAGMKVVGVATTHKPEELPQVEMIIHDFREMDVKTFLNLL